MKRPAAIPSTAKMYATSPRFTNETVPKRLTKTHDTKAGVWGKLIIVKGELDYFLAGAPDNAQRVLAGNTAIIEPQVPHHVELMPGTEFYIEFYRQTREHT